MPVWMEIDVGYVYLARENSEGLTKIGRTHSPRGRQRNLNPLRIFWAAMVRDAVEGEKFLHSLFAEKRIPRTELFRLAAEDVEFIKYEVGRLAEFVVEDFSPTAQIPTAQLGLTIPYQPYGYYFKHFRHGKIRL